MRSSSDPPETASTLSNVFLESERLPPAASPGVTLRGEVNGTTVIKQAFGFSQHEAAAMLAGELPFSRALPAVIPTPPVSAEQMKAVFFQLTVDTLEDNQILVGTHRHSWAVVGGEAGANGIKGFFQLCLEESKFT
jgi:hypothetical protein